MPMNKPKFYCKHCNTRLYPDIMDLLVCPNSACKFYNKDLNSDQVRVVEDSKTKKSILLEAIRKSDSPVFAITIVNQEMFKPEIIKWSAIDNKYKANYIDDTYDDNLVHKHAKGIQIVGWENY